MDFDDKIAITDYKGQEEGALYISVAPCSSDGRALDEEYFVEDPLELIGKPYYYKVRREKRESLSADGRTNLPTNRWTDELPQFLIEHGMTDQMKSV